MSEPDAKLFQTRHGPMWGFRGDRYVSRSLELYGEFSGLEQRLFEQIVKPGMNVVEVGANIGAHTVPLARLCAPGLLYAFEPQQRVFQLLCANLAANDIKNVVATPDAVAEAAGWARLPNLRYDRDLNYGGVEVLPDAQSPGDMPTVRVRVTALDDMELAACHFLKVDVEGFEAQVLRGARRTIERCRPVLYVENDRPERQQELISLIDELGYSQFWHTPSLFDPQNPNGVAEDVFKAVSANLLCFPKGQGRLAGAEPIDPSNWRCPVVAPAAPSVGERLKPAFQAMARGDYATAERVMREVAEAEPGSSDAEHALAALLSTLGQVEEAESRFRRALELKPGHPETELGLALVCLMRGKTEEGWRLYEARNRTRTGAPKPRLAFPEWRGEPLAGKSLHILSDEGFGDQIQQARAVQALADQGAEVTVLCAPALQRLFAQSLPAQVLAAAGQVSVADPDYWILFGDVLGRMGLGPEAAPKPPYLRAANPAAPPGARIGLMTAGNPAHPNNLHRSMPERFAERLRAIPGAISLAPDATGAKDFADTADIVAELDLVISVDTSVAHLAGALGKPVWILLPFLGLDWRWGLSGSTSAWYPSARLFRQPRLEAWGEVVAEVLQALAHGEAPQKSG